MLSLSNFPRFSLGKVNGEKVLLREGFSNEGASLLRGGIESEYTSLTALIISDQEGLKIAIVRAVNKPTMII